MKAKDEGNLKEQGWYKALSQKECKLLDDLISPEKAAATYLKDGDFTINDEFTINGKKYLYDHNVITPKQLIKIKAF